MVRGWRGTGWGQELGGPGLRDSVNGSTMRCRSQSFAVRGAPLSVALVLATVAVPQGRQPRLSPWLDTAVRQARATERLPVWVYFADKGPVRASASPR